MSVETLKSHKKVIGAKQTAKAIEKNIVECVFIAQDAEKRVVSPIENSCKQHGVPVQYIATMIELGKMCNIDVGAATVAVLKNNC